MTHPLPPPSICNMITGICERTSHKNTAGHPTVVLREIRGSLLTASSTVSGLRGSHEGIGAGVTGTLIPNPLGFAARSSFAGQIRDAFYKVFKFICTSLLRFD